MTVQLLLLIAGLLLIVFGADWLVDGASAIARKVGISEFVIGLTIVGFGTSCPELVVSLTGAFEGNADISIGNVIGSNIFNTLLILGLTAVLSPLAITKENKTRDIPITIGVTAILCGCIFLGEIGRIAGVIFLLLFAAYMVYCFKFDNSQTEDVPEKETKLPKAIMLTILGLLFLIFGGKYFVNSSVEIAKALEVSEKFIAITLLAGGTSMPELVTCIVAAAKKKGQLALGNILGSNIFNILLILGCAAVIRPISCEGMKAVDTAVLFLSAVLVFTAAYTGKKNLLDRFDGILMLCCEAAYLVWLFATA